MLYSFRVRFRLPYLTLHVGWCLVVVLCGLLSSLDKLIQNLMLKIMQLLSLYLWLFTMCYFFFLFSLCLVTNTRKSNESLLVVEIFHRDHFLLQANKTLVYRCCWLIKWWQMFVFYLCFTHMVIRLFLNLFYYFGGESKKVISIRKFFILCSSMVCNTWYWLCQVANSLLKFCVCFCR